MSVTPLAASHRVMRLINGLASHGDCGLGADRRERQQSCAETGGEDERLVRHRQANSMCVTGRPRSSQWRTNSLR